MANFHKMGLNNKILEAIMKLGYRIPTPIQRKIIPIALKGFDIVAKARTGSGKTISFLIPILQKLEKHSNIIGIRGIIISPTRELVIQTHKFVRKISLYTNLRIAVFVGGENIRQQFDALSLNPDLVLATPGRLIHLINETLIRLKTIQIIVYDEADCLFELGFALQLRTIQKNLPKEKQVMLFSATFSSYLIEFSTIALKDPRIIQLNTDFKISKKLENQNILSRKEDCQGVLIYLLTEYISKQQQVIVFASTKYHVEYLSLLLRTFGVSNVVIFGNMEQSIRKMNVGKFRFKKVRVMIVTDLAARGIDFPLLENVINFNIPTNPKMFIHRVGRVARIENSGSSWNIVNPFERAYMCDIFRFLNIPLIMKKKEKNGYIVTKSRFGYIPRSILQPNLDSVDKLHNRIDIKTQWNISINGEKMYRKCSNDASKLGIKQSKELDFDVIHPLFVSYYGEEEKKNDIIINEIKNFKSHNTIFKLNEKEINYWKILKNIQRRKHKNPKAKTLQFVKIKEELTLIKKKKRNFRDNKFFIFCKKVERNIKEKQ